MDKPKKLDGLKKTVITAMEITEKATIALGFSANKHWNETWDTNGKGIQLFPDVNHPCVKTTHLSPVYHKNSHRFENDAQKEVR